MALAASLAFLVSGLLVLNSSRVKPPPADYASNDRIHYDTRIQIAHTPQERAETAIDVAEELRDKVRTLATAPVPNDKQVRDLANFYSDLVKVELQNHARALPSDAEARVLELGAGSGCISVSIALAKRSARMVATELSPDALEVARANTEGLGVADRVELRAGDLFQPLATAERFEVVVLDPPGFARSRAGTFSAARDWPRLTEAAAAVLAPRGILLAACNVAALESRRFDAALEAGIRRGGRSATDLARPGPSPLDFPTPAGEEPPLKVRALLLSVLTSHSGR